MHPVLVIEGVAHKVKTVEFSSEGTVEGVSYFNEGKYRYVYDVKARLGLTGSEVMDLSHALIWPGRYEPVIESLNKRIDAHEEHLADLERDHMKFTKNKDGLPFVDVEIEKVVNQHIKLEFITDGLHEALGIITGEFMEEDVDLSGGEENAS